MHFEPRSELPQHVQDFDGWDEMFAKFHQEFPTLTVIEEPGSTVSFN